VTIEVEPGWEVPLEGQAYDLVRLAQSFRTDAARVVRRDDATFVLRSQSFESLIDARAVQEEARTLLVLMDGALRTLSPEHRAVSVSGSLRRVDADGLGHVFVLPLAPEVQQPAAVRGADEAADQQDGPDLDDRGSELLAVAFRDPLARRALELLAQPRLTWDDWYRLLKLAESDLTRGEPENDWPRIAEKGWASPDELLRFRAVADRPGLTRRLLRRRSTVTPMTAMEAQELAQRVLREWLVSKIGS
jgi:hypothetical protein